MESLKKFLPINFELITNPVNWVIIVLMVALAGIGLALVFQNTDNKGNTN